MSQPLEFEVSSRGALADVRLILAAAGLALLVSLFLPYWQVELTTANHPEGLRLFSYLGHFEGAPAGPGLERLERSQVVAAATVLVLLVLAAVFARHRWAALLGLPAIVFPAAIFADLAGALPAALCVLDPLVLGCACGSAPLWARFEAGGMALASGPGSGMALAVAGAALILAAGLRVASGARRDSSMC